MVYGEGFSLADDVDAHELTHAVTEKTANLFYYMQSGALNESFSDIFGESVDLLNGAGNDDPSQRWLMGEEVPGFGAMRSMMNPNLYGDPGRTGDSQYYCDYNDGGGVHWNSGVPNHFFALLDRRRHLQRPDGRTAGAREVRQDRLPHADPIPDDGVERSRKPTTPSGRAATTSSGRPGSPSKIAPRSRRRSTPWRWISPCATRPPSRRSARRDRVP